MSKWREACLNEITEIILSNVDKKINTNEKQVLLCNYLDAYQNRYLSGKHLFSNGSVNNLEWARFHLLKNDVVITKDSEEADDIAIPSVILESIDKLVCGYHLAILRSKGEVGGRFLMNLLQLDKVKKQFSNTANGITRYGLTINAIESAKLYFPTSLFEQRKIAGILATVDDLIEKTEAAIAKYKAIKHGMMQDLFTSGLDKNGKLRPKYQNAPELYRKTELGWIPKEWELTRIVDSCSNFINGGTPSTKNLRYWSGTMPWVTGADFLESFGIGTIRRFITEDAVRNSSTHIVKGGNILLVTRTGVGKLAVAPFDIAISQDVTGLILDPEVFDVKFFYYYLQSLVVIFKKMNQGTSINGIIRNDLENTLVVKPKIEEQDKIAKILSATNREIATEIQTLNKTQKLRLALMSALLTGKVRVKYEEDKNIKEAKHAATY